MPPASVAEAELDRRAEHAVRRLSEDLAPADLHAVRHRRADGRQRHQITDLHVEGAAPHLERLPVSGVHVDALHVVGVGMRPQRKHLRDDHAVDRFADPLDVVDREAEVVHQLGERVDVVAHGRELVQPGEEHAHQNCSKNRMSLVNISRRSSMP